MLKRRLHLSGRLGGRDRADVEICVMERRNSSCFAKSGMFISVLKGSLLCCHAPPLFPMRQWSLRGTSAADGKMEFKFTGVQSKQNNVFNIPAV